MKNILFFIFHLLFSNDAFFLKKIYSNRLRHRHHRFFGRRRRRTLGEQLSSA
jgi:hypothetical protein